MEGVTRARRDPRSGSRFRQSLGRRRKYDIEALIHPAVFSSLVYYCCRCYGDGDVGGICFVLCNLSQLYVY